MRNILGVAAIAVIIAIVLIFPSVWSWVIGVFLVLGISEFVMDYDGPKDE